MSEKDTISKTLESYADVFADIINGFLFNGEQIVLPEELTPADTFSQYKADGQVRPQERDVSKYWRRCSINIAFLGIENQSDPYKYMPMRGINYDAAAYRKQLNEKGDKHCDGLYHPVITLVLYLEISRGIMAHSFTIVWIFRKGLRLMSATTGSISLICISLQVRIS